MASAGEMKRSWTQLTHFDCQAPKKLHLDDHLDIEDTRSDARLEINDAVHESSADAEDLQSKYQENIINIDKPPTTIIINNNQPRSSTSELDLPVPPVPCQSTAKYPTDIAEGPLHSPIQPHTKFPSSTAGSKKRSFIAQWYKKYHWLEYSIMRDAAFCYPCRLFGRASPGRYADTFTEKGFRNWKHATGQSGMLSKHDSSHIHKQSMLLWCEYTKNTKKILQ